MISDMEYYKAADIVRRYKKQEDKEYREFVKNLHAENKRKDSEFQGKVDSGEIVITEFTPEEKEFFRRF